MPNADPSDQEKLLQLLAESARRAGSFSGKSLDVSNFEGELMRSMAPAWIARPIGMRMLMFFFRMALLMQDYWLAFRPCITSSRQLYHEELRQALRFGTCFGRMANASQRMWCAAQIERLGITYFDAPILVWSYTIDFRRRRFYFGHWDWIVGVFQMYQVGFLGFAVFATCLCPCFQAHEKALSALIYVTIMVFVFKLHKGSSFDVYRIGVKYLRPRGWGITPVIRSPRVTSVESRYN